ncbi:hypothetical protein OBBRIDRAFT_389113 [Obba rivulosa]|uniref:Uncharacterized protein n=1 Tax=Obba rivulosa TaxID=1052685 RepID=A0A8E2AI75_9APHY|nr:hypothetical protein OBBRIDRAFT_389113 [Obba rivulosa]
MGLQRAETEHPNVRSTDAPGRTRSPAADRDGLRLWSARVCGSNYSNSARAVHGPAARKGHAATSEMQRWRSGGDVRGEPRPSSAAMLRCTVAARPGHAGTNCSRMDAARGCTSAEERGAAGAGGFGAPLLPQPAGASGDGGAQGVGRSGGRPGDVVRPENEAEGQKRKAAGSMTGSGSAAGGRQNTQKGCASARHRRKIVENHATMANHVPAPESREGNRARADSTGAEIALSSRLHVAFFSLSPLTPTSTTPAPSSVSTTLPSSSFPSNSPLAVAPAASETASSPVLHIRVHNPTYLNLGVVSSFFYPSTTITSHGRAPCPLYA